VPEKQKRKHIKNLGCFERDVRYIYIHTHKNHVNFVAKFCCGRDNSNVV
jgi:hypothetical protein